MIRPALLACLALAGCSYSSLDDEIFPTVVSASVAADPGTPAELAPIQITLQLKGGSRASSPAIIDEVALGTGLADPTDETNDKLQLDVGFPETFDTFIHENETKTIALQNRGTTNADVAPLCGQNLTLTILLADANEATAWTVADAAVNVVCP